MDVINMSLIIIVLLWGAREIKDTWTYNLKQWLKDSGKTAEPLDIFNAHQILMEHLELWRMGEDPAVSPTIQYKFLLKIQTRIETYVKGHTSQSDPKTLH